MRTLVSPPGSRRFRPPACALAALLAAALPAGAATITVNNTGWNRTGMNGVMSLPEAVGLAAGDAVCLDNAEKALVSGVSNWLFVAPCWTIGPPFEMGDGVVDTVVIAGNLTFFPQQTPSAGPTLVLDELDDLTGPGALDGSSAGGSSAAIRLDSDWNAIRRLTIFDFPGEGIVCRGCKQMLVEGSTIFGNSIGINAYAFDSSNPNFVQIGTPGDPVTLGNSILLNDVEGIKITVDPAFDNPADYDIVIQNNWIGDDGTITDAGNGGDGIYLQNVRGAQIGGAGANQRNFVNFNNGSGLRVTGTQADNNVIENNFVGLDEGGFLSKGNTFSGVLLSGGASNNNVWDNFFAGNGGPGVDIWDEASDDNNVFGNRIGTTADGSSARPNGGGVRIVGGADNTEIGTAVAGDRNLISGNSTHGVGIYNTGTTGTIVRGNWIGVNAAGTAALPNTGDGVRIQEQATGSLVELNTISGNGNDGVGIRHAGTNANTVQLNDIGVRPGTTLPLGNAASGVAILSGAASNTVLANDIAASGGWGVYVADSGSNANLIDNNVVGFSGAGNVAGGVTLRAAATNNNVEDNVIGFNAGPGVELDGASTQLNDVYRNKIGTNSAGTVAAPNFRGVRIWNGATNNVIGGANASLANVISGNAGYGVGIWNASTTGNQVLSNLIGTNAAGTAALANGSDGVQIGAGSTTSLLDGNVISANVASGVRLLDAGTSASLRRNKIGTGVSQATALPNGSHGVWVDGAEGPVSLGNGAGFDNVIAHNGGSGVLAGGGGATAFYGSLVYANGGLAIDLDADGVTPNDLLDADGGTNGLLNMPVLVSAVVISSVNLHVEVKFHGAPSTQHRLHLFTNAACDASRHGEAEAAPFASVLFTTDAAGNATTSVNDTGLVGDVLTALVTRESVPKLVSELSTCRTAVDATSPLIFDDSFESGLVDAWSTWSL